MKCVGVQKTLSVFEGGKVVKLEISYEEYRDLKRRIEELEREVFVKLAKHVHTRVTPYEESTIHSWTRKTCDKIPRKCEDLTYEEQKLSIEMLNELIPIYNKYFKLAHPEICIIYRDEKRQFVSVEDV